MTASQQYVHRNPKRVKVLDRRSGKVVEMDRDAQYIPQPPPSQTTANFEAGGLLHMQLVAKYGADFAHHVMYGALHEHRLCQQACWLRAACA
jgi:hypothetical protein